MKQAMVTGATGFVGRRVVSSLIERGTAVNAVVHRKPLPIAHPLLSKMDGGLMAIPEVLALDHNIEAIFHMARPSLPAFRRWGRTLAGWQAWWLNRRLVNRLAENDHWPPIYFASGTLMYGNQSNTIYEDAPLQPISYARQYKTGELPILKALRSSTYPLIVFRLPWLLGEGSWFKWFYLDNIREHGAIPVFGNGHNIMSLLNAEDAAALMCNYAMQNVDPGIYHIYNPLAAITQNEFADMVCSEFNCKSVHYRQLYPFELESAVFEAFTANLQPGTHYPELLQGFNFTAPEATLKQIKAAFEK